jgi:RHS repeat-associated protein
MTYDANGNLLSVTDPSSTNTLTWDARNRLVAISDQSTSASFMYDSLGRRVSKTINGTTTEYLYDRNDIIAETNGGVISAAYLRGLNIDEPFLRQSSIHEFYLADALGSVVALTDQTGAIHTTYSYDPFGNTVVDGASVNPFQYTGRENDGTAFYYYRARYYSPALQRFISEDPIGLDAGDLNLYSYVGQNPVTFIDPNGLRSPTTTVTAAVGTAASFFRALNVAGTYGKLPMAAVIGEIGASGSLATIGTIGGGVVASFGFGYGLGTILTWIFPDLGTGGGDWFCDVTGCDDPEDPGTDPGDGGPSDDYPGGDDPGDAGPSDEYPGGVGPGDDDPGDGGAK